MTQIETQQLTRDDYYRLEEIAEQKHEFYQGEIFAMSGGTFNHARISGNVFSTLLVKLRGKSCQPTNSDMRIETPEGLITYPDAAVYCGKPELTENQCSLLNPVTIIEVLSPSTRRYDKIDKFTLYRSISSFQDYLLIDSEKIAVQHYRKSEPNEWILHDYLNIMDSIYLKSIQETFLLIEIYDGVAMPTYTAKNLNSENL
ncbi:MAG: Uma2 family endonuclease [Methylococcales bacterium]